jgi:pyruvate kinase
VFLYRDTIPVQTLVMPVQNRTRIVATIGPASASVPILVRMIRGGMNVARLNFSHGTHQDHKRLIRHIRTAAKKAGTEVSILQDLQGPKMRVGNLPEDGVYLKSRQIITFSTAVDEYKEGSHLPVTHKNLHKDVKKGHHIYLDDGLMELEVQSVRGRIIKAKVLVGGVLLSHKGMNLPDSKISIESFTKKDAVDLAFGLEQGVDWVALSFVTGPAIIKKVRRIMQAKSYSLKQPTPKIFAKIERREAVDNFVGILAEVDGILLARGDLGIEMPYEEVPIIQKEFIEICRQAGKPVIVATHMLQSMTVHARATRAEVSDVANAVIDHADAVMLSAETATGKYPYLTVHTMATVIEEAEQSRFDDITFYQLHGLDDVETAIAQALHVMCENDHIVGIVTAMSYGSVAHMVNTFRPNVPIHMACPKKEIARQALVRAGIHPFVLGDDPGTFVMRAERYLRKNKMIPAKKKIAYLTSSPGGEIQLTIR